MFELDLMKLISKYKTSSSDDEKKEIQVQMGELINNNPSDYQKFAGSGNLSQETQDILTQSRTTHSEHQSKEQSDFELIREQYEGWLKFYQSNNSTPDSNCEQIIVKLINFYAPNKFEVLKEILDIKDSNEYEAFKTMLKNYLRKYYIGKLRTYRNSVEFEELGFFSKLRILRRIELIYKDLGNYIFSIEKIKEVLG